MAFYQVAIAAYFWDTLIYEGPDGLEPGQWVQVPLKSRIVKGCIWQPLEPDAPVPPNVKSIKQSWDPSLNLKEPWRQWAAWLAQHYVYPLGLVLEYFFPPTKPQKFLNLGPGSSTPQLLPLTAAQKKVFDDIRPLIFEGFRAILLQGVTGSGKTEIYLHLTQEVLNLGGQVLFLVPEIALTPQLEKRIRQAVNAPLGVFHSDIKPTIKQQIYYQVQDSRPFVLLGTRSALFVPLPNLKLIILDEEHETHLKQQTHLTYHGRTSALKLAQILNIPVILGSATPSAESYFWASRLKAFTLVQLNERYQKKTPLEVHLVDRRIHRPLSGDPAWLTPILKSHMEHTLAQGYQVILWLNQRGFAPVVMCDQCGYHFQCPNCDVSLTLHSPKWLVCHYCGYQSVLPDCCPKCQNSVLKPLGYGIEQIYDDVKNLWPQINVFRMDRDHVTTWKQLSGLIEKFERGEGQILIGTQMLAKGLNFPKLKLCGIIDADSLLRWPDFRTQEKALQLMMQLMGRVGRFLLPEPAQVIIQTYEPQNPFFSYLLSQNYEAFIQQELLERQRWGYPPFRRLILIRLEHPKKEIVWKDSHWVAESLRSFFAKNHLTQVLGPAPAYRFRLKSYYRYQVLIKSHIELPLSRLFKKWLDGQSLKLRAKIRWDVDPEDLLD